MNNIALITGADRGLGLAMTESLAKKGWLIFAGQYIPEWTELTELTAKYPGIINIIPMDVASDESVRHSAKLVSELTDRIDLLINNAGISSPSMFRDIHEPQDYNEMSRMYDVNALGPIRAVEAFLPMLELGSLKRLCFVSSEAGSINCCERKSWYGYCMSKAALNMGVKILFNKLKPKGYTFRLYHPGWMRTYIGGTKNEAADLEPEEAAVAALVYFLRERSGDVSNRRYDDDRLILRDWRGCEMSW